VSHQQNVFGGLLNRPRDPLAVLRPDEFVELPEKQQKGIREM
jgi:hypothetical protein